MQRRFEERDESRMRVFTAQRVAVLSNFFLDQEAPKFEVLPAYLSPAHSLTPQRAGRA